MDSPTITIIGTHGRNLSRYLKDHLQSKGIQSYAVGMHFKNLSTVQKIKNSKTLICIHGDIAKAVKKELDVGDKHIICLDVNDSSESSSSKPLTGEMWQEYQRNYARPQLEGQIKKHLSELT